MSVETALKVIENHSFRWSSPLKFNDPFDTQIGFTFEFNGTELGRGLLDEMEKIVFEGKTDFKEPTLLIQLALLLQSKKDQLSKSEVMGSLAETTHEMASKFEQQINELHSELRQNLTHSRVLCLSETNDNVVMWSHYGEEHQGVVVKLLCIDELDNSLLVARKVDYSNRFPLFPSLEKYVQHLTGEEPLDFDNLTWDFAYTKHEDWSYEKEWRVHMPLLQDPAGDGYSIFREDPRVFGAVYLGCRMDEEGRKKVLAAVEEYIPHARVYQCKRSSSSFELVFDEVKKSRTKKSRGQPA